MRLISPSSLTRLGVNSRIDLRSLLKGLKLRERSDISFRPYYSEPNKNYKGEEPFPLVADATRGKFAHATYAPLRSRKLRAHLSERRESNPRDQLGRLAFYH